MAIPQPKWREHNWLFFKMHGSRFFALARIKYRDLKVLDALSPFILRHVDEYEVAELVPHVCKHYAATVF